MPLHLSAAASTAQQCAACEQIHPQHRSFMPPTYYYVVLPRPSGPVVYSVPLSIRLIWYLHAGAAMFVQCIVASEVMRATVQLQQAAHHRAHPDGPGSSPAHIPGVKCRGATLRDVAAYSCALLLVLATFAGGSVTHLFVAGAAVLYACYVVWVFLGDEWHEAGRPKPRAVLHALRDSLHRRWVFT